MTLRSLAAALALACLALPAGPARAGQPPSTGSTSLLPFESGKRVMAYIAAFNGGNDEAMLAYFAANVSPDAPARSAEERREIYHRLRDDLGSLSVARVGETREDHVVLGIAGSTGQTAEFAWDFEPKAPHRLLGITIRLGDAPGTGEPPPLPPLEAPPSAKSEDVAAAVRAYAARLEREFGLSGVVLVARGDEPVVAQGYGLADRAAGVANTPDTSFNVGSIGKDFTALAIGRLVADGKLALDDTIGKHLPQYPNADAAAKVTIRQLLAHRSGIGDIFNDRFDATPKDRIVTVDDYLKLFADQPLAFEPGSRQRYSNGGYIVLGAILEKVTGKSYDEVVRSLVFEPAGMKRTGLFETDEIVPHRATGYTRHTGGRNEGSWRSNVHVLPGKGSPAGGAYATAGDLLRFARAVAAGKILPLALEHAVLRPTERADGPLDGLGIAGGAPGVNADIEADFTTGWTVVVLANVDPPLAAQAAARIDEWLRGGR